MKMPVALTYILAFFALASSLPIKYLLRTMYFNSCMVRVDSRSMSFSNSFRNKVSEDVWPPRCRFRLSWLLAFLLLWFPLAGGGISWLKRQASPFRHDPFLKKNLHDRVGGVDGFRSGSGDVMAWALE
jgi:hypothetical protein